MKTVHPNLHCQQEQHTFQATMNFKWISANKCKFILTCQLFVLLLLIPPTKFLFRSTTNATTCQPDKFGIPSNVLFCIARYQADFSEPSPTHDNQPVVRPDLRNLESSLALLERWEHMLTKNLPCLLTVATFVWLRILFIDETICG